MQPMIRVGFLRRLSLALLLGVMFGGSGLAQGTADFAGDWVLRLGNRVFLVVSLSPVPGSTTTLTGSLVRPQHFSTNNGVGFSSIGGPVIHHPIVRSSRRENCLSFTTQNPADKNDEDDFQLCLGEPGRGTLRILLPTFELWPVSKEKEPWAVATDWNSARSYFLDDSNVSNAEMEQIFAADQKEREAGIEKIDWAVVGKADAARRQSTRQLLADGKLHTGEDFERAAFVFQHGSAPDDYLPAHTLAMVAVSRGQSSALWIAAATLDRYLNSIHQPQIYGTQFHFEPGKPTTQEPYNRGLIPDALRRELGVPSHAAQEEQRKQYEVERSHTK